jgi:hypothetical protein
VVAKGPLAFKAKRAFLPARKLAKKVFIPFQVILGIRNPQDLGGTELDQNLLGGTCAVVDPVSGTAANANALGGNATDPNVLLGGAETEPNVLGGAVVVADPVTATEVDWTMQEVDIHLAEWNDETLNLTLTSGGSALNITGMQLDVFLKTKAGVADTDGTTIKLSTVTGEVTITNGPGGLANVAVPAMDLSAVTIGFWRCDTVVGGKRNTAIFGTVSVTPL